MVKSLPSLHEALDSSPNTGAVGGGQNVAPTGLHTL